LEKAELELRREPAGAEEREGTSCARNKVDLEGRREKRERGSGVVEGLVRETKTVPQPLSPPPACLGSSP
jgi:hypothetical protein